MPPAKTTTRDLTAELAFLTRALKAPTLHNSVARLAERARTEGWSHEELIPRQANSVFTERHSTYPDARRTPRPPPAAAADAARTRAIHRSTPPPSGHIGGPPRWPSRRG
jgi:hypothetical protein